MAKLSGEWWDAFQGCFETEADVIEFIFERLNTSDFEESFVNVGGGEPNECFKITAEDKKETLYNFMMELITQ